MNWLLIISTLISVAAKAPTIAKDVSDIVGQLTQHDDQAVATVAQAAQTHIDSQNGETPA